MPNAQILNWLSSQQLPSREREDRNLKNNLTRAQTSNTMMDAKKKQVGLQQADQMNALTTQHLAGDKSALAQMMALDPETTVKMEEHYRKKDKDQLERDKLFWQQAGSIAQLAKDEQQWKDLGLEKLGPFANKDLIINRALTADQAIDNAMNEKKYQLDKEAGGKPTSMMKNAKYLGEVLSITEKEAALILTETKDDSPDKFRRKIYSNLITSQNYDPDEAMPLADEATSTIFPEWKPKGAAPLKKSKYRKYWQ